MTSLGSFLSGVQLLNERPDEEHVELQLLGRSYFVTQAEIERVRSLPDAAEMRAKIERYTALLSNVVKQREQ
ncbi:hypothetical protein SEA_EASTWEST_70 [Arthrobacter phage EastWest]|uniref:Uncharacterized protein n=1 Tax=Arthrobacter phage EastWest TaxID=2894292 RepID=A0AAE8YK78_9CAUD|nr:hypothetical protein SEA_EASTWEST_70 [Arthrobacter phage EastWest]